MASGRDVLAEDMAHYRRDGGDFVFKAWEVADNIPKRRVIFVITPTGIRICDENEHEVSFHKMTAIPRYTLRAKHCQFLFQERIKKEEVVFAFQFDNLLTARKVYDEFTLAAKALAQVLAQRRKEKKRTLGATKAQSKSGPVGNERVPKLQPPPPAKKSRVARSRRSSLSTDQVADSAVVEPAEDRPVLRRMVSEFSVLDKSASEGPGVEPGLMDIFGAPGFANSAFNQGLSANSSEQSLTPSAGTPSGFSTNPFD